MQHYDRYVTFRLDFTRTMHLEGFNLATKRDVVDEAVLLRLAR